VLGPPGDYIDLALSPDGRHVVVSKRQENNTDLWLLDAERGVPARFTFDRASEEFPVWSPDGNQIVFTSSGAASGDLFRKPAGNTESQKLLLKSDLQKRAFDWSADGKFLLYDVLDPKTLADLWVLPLEGEPKPVPFLAGPYQETQGQFSPGPSGGPRWVAYSSDESGRFEIYVRPFPAATRQFRISTAGGEEPRWRRDGKELYYLAPDGKLMAVEVKTAPEFQASVPKVLFQTKGVVFSRGPRQRNFRWAPSADGQRFLMISRPEATTDAPITVVLNWEAAVKR